MDNEDELIVAAKGMTSTQIARIIKELADELKNRVNGLIVARRIGM